MAVASTSEQRRVAAALRSEGLSWADIAAVLRDRYGLGALQAARVAHSWSQTTAADQWNARWPDEPTDQKTLSRWECWPWSESGVMPRLSTLERLAQLYAVSASDLVAGWADHRPETILGRSPDRYPAGVDRRTFLGVVAGAGVATSLPSSVKAGRIGAADVELLRERYWALWHADEAQGGAAVYRAVLDQLAEVQALRDRARYGSSVGQHLRVLVGHLQDHAAFTAYDAGEHDIARQHFTEALATARVADDDALTVYVMAEMANQTSYLGQGRETVELAEAAQRLARPFARPRLVAVLASREAEGHALRGDAGAAQAALGRAEDELADAGDDSGHWSEYFTPEMLAASASRTWLTLGAPVAAERCARESIGPALARRPQARNCVGHAQALVAAGQLDQAAAVTVQAVELGSGVASVRMRADLASLGPALAGHEGVRGVPEALAALATV